MKTNYDKINDIMTFTITDEESYGEEKNDVTVFYSLTTNNITEVVINNYSKKLAAGELDYLNLPKTCKKCGKNLRITKMNYIISILDKKVLIRNTPILRCSCGETVVEDRIIKNIHTFFDNIYLPDDTYDYSYIAKMLKK